MEIGARIKSRRLELELSVDDLASKIGKNRATIYRYEKGDIENLPVSIIEPLAEALCTTPEYLMGWTDDPLDYDNIDELYVPRGCNMTPEEYYKFKQAEAKDAQEYMAFTSSRSTAWPLLKEVHFDMDPRDPRLVERYVETDDDDTTGPPEPFFWFRCPDESLQELGIRKKDLLLFMEDSSPSMGSIALAVVKGEDKPILGEIERLDNAIIIHPKNRDFRSRAFIGKDVKNVRLLGDLYMAKIYFTFK